MYILYIISHIHTRTRSISVYIYITYIYIYMHAHTHTHTHTYPQNCMAQPWSAQQSVCIAHTVFFFFGDAARVIQKEIIIIKNINKKKGFIFHTCSPGRYSGCWSSLRVLAYMRSDRGGFIRVWYIVGAQATVRFSSF